MWFVEHVSLVDFYKIHLAEVRRRGFKLLVLALIREADAPGFYEDLRRYWTSLDDVTGDHIVFAVAGGPPFHSQKVRGFGSTNRTDRESLQSLVCAPFNTQKNGKAGPSPSHPMGITPVWAFTDRGSCQKN